MPNDFMLDSNPVGLRPPGFSCLRSTTASSVRLTVAGELDIASVPTLDRALRRAEADAAQVVLDLRALDFMDSSGAHLLTAADARIRRAGGRLVVMRGPAEVQWFLELTRVDRRLELVGEPPGTARPATVLGGAPSRTPVPDPRARTIGVRTPETEEVSV